MPSVSGGIMEKLEGENYKIVIDDAFKWLKTYKFVFSPFLFTLRNILSRNNYNKKINLAFPICKMKYNCVRQIFPQNIIAYE